MSLSAFLTALFEHGRVRVGPWGEDLSPDDRAAAERSLAECERHIRLDFPETPPAFEPRAALWAARTFYRASQLAVYRYIDAKTVEESLADPCPQAHTAAAHYSVDLVFRCLPDLARLARSAATEDPLVKSIHALGGEWPLSSVGMAAVDISDAAAEAIVSQRGLLRYYVDRIISRNDKSRLANPRVREAVKAALGGHASLAPDLAAALHDFAPGAAL